MAGFHSMKIFHRSGEMGPGGAVFIIPFLIVLALLYSAGTAHAGVNVYLISRVETDGAVTLGDIARIDSDKDTAARLRSIAVEPELYQDGYLDRKELEHLLTGTCSETVFIYGGAVRITRIIIKDTDEEAAEKEAAEELLVKKGDAVAITIRNRGILIHVSGSAMQDGKKGEEISVRIKGNHTLRGKITDRKLIELMM